MIRVLVMIAVTGFLVSVVTLSTAVAIGGPEILTDTAWNGWHGGHWGWSSDDWADRGSRHWGHDGGPQGTREMAWTGGDTLDVDLPAEITYTQAAGPGKLTISGPQRALDALEIEGGRLRCGHGRHHGMELTIVMTAPAVTHFDLSGSGKLEIRDYKQDKLSLDLSGDTEVSAKGETQSLALSIDGSGDTDLTDLKVADAAVDIQGSGQATLAPTGSANINISGSGDVTLLTRPAKLESDVSGSGSIHQKDGTSTETPPPAPPKARRGRT
jgi:Putative auto-transporter adhesin, head GIN domain